MKIPYSIQGFVFAPALIGLVFFLKVTCPAPTGAGCFADIFLAPVFMPITFLYKALNSIAPTLARHEVLFILGYWALVGFFAGLCVDVLKKREVSV